MRALPFVVAMTFLALSTLPAQAADVGKAPPPAPYQAVSKLVTLPDFLPGMGTLYVDPKTLPAGPFLAYAKSGKLVSTIFMIPLEDINAHKKFDALKTSGHKVDHVDLYFNPGHPGVEKPHYHIVLWHVPESEAASVK
ncbi:MAG: hypothetical protein WCF85_16425 [Rhodospirillaceae bacterium]